MPFVKNTKSVLKYNWSFLKLYCGRLYFFTFWGGVDGGILMYICYSTIHQRTRYVFQIKKYKIYTIFFNEVVIASKQTASYPW